jgi:hypothetical protein
MTTEQEDPNPFDSFDSAASIMAFCRLHFGEDGLRGLLALIEADHESLERDAQELEAIGLPKVAAIVSEAAVQAPSELERCPYSPEDRCNYQSWMASYERRVRFPCE